MTRLRSIALAVALLGVAGTAGADPAIDSLEHALPHGWSLLATDRELVIRYDHACYATTPRATPAAAPPSTPDQNAGPLVTLELRFQIEPRWPTARLAAARATNVQLAADVAAARTRYQIDALPIAHGAPRATTADERTRLAAYRQVEALAASKQVALPTCGLGELSVFAGPQTYAALAHAVDPPHAMTEARTIAELIKQRCVAE